VPAVVEGFLKQVCFVTRFVAVLLVLVVANSNPRLLAQQLSARPGALVQSFIAAQETADSSTLPLNFKNARLYSTGNISNYGIAVADLNGDGHPDVVVTGFSSPASLIGVMMGNGDGTFAAPTTYSTGGTIAYSVAIADVNGDGFLDLIVANQYASDSSSEGSVGVLLGNGDGTFQPVFTYDSGGKRAQWVAVADVNGDKHPDIIVTNGCAGECQSTRNGLVSVLLNDGKGSFLPARNYSDGASALGMPESIAVGDFNGDGHPDIVVSNQCADTACSTGSLGVLLNKGDGTFRAPVQYSSGGYFYGQAVAVADMNGDGKLDLIVGNWCFNSTVCSGFQTGAVSVLLGNGDGTFQAPVTSIGGMGVAASLAVGDVNGDGHPDVLVTGGYVVDVLLGNGDGTLQTPVGYSGTNGIASVAIADLNGDGRPDLLSADDYASVSVWLNALKKSATTVMTSSANPVLINQPVTFTATITSDSPIPDGTVITFSDRTELGTATTKNGMASFTTAFPQAKTYDIHVSFPGDAFHGKSSAGLIGGEVVTRYSSTTILTSSPNPSSSGQAVTLTAKVTSSAPGGPTGTVAFKNGATLLGTSTLNGGTATLITTRLAVGTLTITADYKGDTQSATSSGTTSQTVN
jgi:Bacterial Ig-like domain (group 3)/FG-GAP-like repeat/FG-GAP repeat